MKYSSLITLTVGTAMLACSCSSNEPGPNGGDARPIVLNVDEMAIAATANSFSLDFYNHTAATEGSGNFMVSPLSLSMAMSMVATGAQGPTCSEIIDVLGFKESDIDAVNRLNSRLMTELTAVDPSTTLSLANSIWFDSSLDLKPAFIETNTSAYNADIFCCDLSSEKSKDAINSWASEKTQGMIPHLLKEPIGAEKRMALMNALYFKGIWASKFSKKLTNKQTFHSADGSARPVDMMHANKISCTVAHDDAGATWLHLPYGKKAFEMVLILPDAEDNSALEEYMSSLSATAYAENLEMSWPCDAKVTLPKFEIENDLNLLNTLKELGIHKALTSGADFGKISDADLYIGSAMQRTVIKVDEEGTEAAAVSKVEIAVNSPGPTEVREFVFDRPFAFIVRECSSGIVLFTGRVSRL